MRNDRIQGCGGVSLISGVLALAILLVLSTAAEGNIYRWRDSKGAVHYDQSLPDRAVSRGYQILNDAGDVLKRVPPPLTSSQRTAATAKASAAARLATKREAQKRQDRMLLQTFDSVGDIKRMRNQRLKALGIQIELARDRVQQLSGEGSDAQRKNAQSDLAALLTQRVDVRRVFAQDIQRFRELQTNTPQ